LDLENPVTLDLAKIVCPKIFCSRRLTNLVSPAKLVSVFIRIAQTPPEILTPFGNMTSPLACSKKKIGKIYYYAIFITIVKHKKLSRKSVTIITTRGGLG
jgi:hypothetical protein